MTVKIRKGFDEEHINGVEIAKIIEEAGAAAEQSTEEPESSTIPARQTGTLSDR